MAREAPGPWHPHHYIPPGTRSLLDVGCNVGAGLEFAHELGVRQLYGIEINPDAAREAARRLSRVEGARVVQGSADELPFETGCAEAAICSEVLEHVPAELRKGVVRQVSRALAPGARFIVTVPAAGALAFLDPANVRLAFPRLFGALSRAIGGRAREDGYVGQKHGVVRHHHFTLEELRALLEPEFEIELVRHRGFALAPVTNWLQFPFYRLKACDNAVFKLIAAAGSWEMSKDLGERLGYNVLVVARNRRSAR